MKITSRQVPAAVAAREEFDGHGSVRAAIVKWTTAVGVLPDKEADRLYDELAATEGRGLYVVYSYRTPIAWGAADGSSPLYMPDEHYSVTTSRHQGLVRRGEAMR